MSTYRKLHLCKIHRTCYNKRSTENLQCIPFSVRPEEECSISRRQTSAPVYSSVSDSCLLVVDNVHLGFKTRDIIGQTLLAVFPCRPVWSCNLPCWLCGISKCIGGAGGGGYWIVCTDTILTERTVMTRQPRGVRSVSVASNNMARPT